jgi:hypothetical protein
MKDAMDSSANVEEMEALLELGQLTIKQAREAGVGGGIIKNIEMIHKGLQTKYNHHKKAKGTGAQEGKVLTGKTLKDFKPSEAPRVVQLLTSKKTEMALDDYVDTIYKDLQMLEAMGVSVLGDDVIEKITELTKMKDDMEREDAWQEFVEQKKCKK